MRNRYNFLKYTFGRFKHKTMTDVNRELKVTFTKAEILALVCMALLFISITIPHEVISGIIIDGEERTAIKLIVEARK